MTTSRTLSARRIMATACALAALGTPAAVAASTLGAGAPLAACTSGEEADVFTTTCVPFMVPNSSSQGFTSTAANPDIPEIDGVPCTGRDGGSCIGLSEEQDDMGPQPVPRSTISSSP